MENHHFQWENPLFLWPFSIATLNYQRVDHGLFFLGWYSSNTLPIKQPRPRGLLIQGWHEWMGMGKW